MDDRVDVEVRANGFASAGRPDEERLVGLEPVQREAVLVAVDRHGPQAELSRGAETPDGNFGSVGDKKLPDAHGGWGSPGRVRKGQEPEYVECMRSGQSRPDSSCAWR